MENPGGKRPRERDEPPDYSVLNKVNPAVIRWDFFPEDLNDKVIPSKHQKNHIVNLNPTMAAKLANFNQKLQQDLGQGVSLVPIDSIYFKVAEALKTNSLPVYNRAVASKIFNQLTSYLTTNSDKKKREREEVVKIIEHKLNTEFPNIYLYPRIQDYQLNKSKTYLDNFNNLVNNYVEPAPNVNQPRSPSPINNALLHNINQTRSPSPINNDPLNNAQNWIPHPDYIGDLGNPYTPYNSLFSGQ